MEIVHWIYTPFLLATLCTITGFVTGFPTTTEIVTEYVDLEVQSSPAHVFDTQETIQPLLPDAPTSPSKVTTSVPNNNGEPGIPPVANNASQSTTNPVPTSPNVPTTTQVSTATPTTTTRAPPTTTPIPVTPSQAIFTPPSTVSPTHSTTKLVTTLLPITTTLRTTTSAVTTTTPTTTPTSQTPTVLTTATLTAVTVHEKTLRVATAAAGSTPQEAPTTSSTSTHIPDNQTTKESGDWNIIGITGNSFTGKILLPIAVGTAFSVIIIAVAYCYCSRKGPRRVAKSSRNGVHRMTSNDRVMLLADSSEDEF